ncbi:hypothetical protein K8R47_00095 [archaeon]|nr:hypothetical protein [archaeon]
MKKIILDTNFILVPFQFKVDIFEEFKRICDFQYKLYILDKSLDELKKIKKEKAALSLIKQKNIKVIKTKNADYVDDQLKKLKNVIIATNDKKLIKQLKTPYIRLKQKKYLIIKNVL